MYLSDVLLLLDISTLEKILRPARPRHIPPPCCGCKLGATLALATHISECVKVAQLSIVMVGGGVEDENMFYVLHPQVHQERIAQPLEGGKPQLVLEAARVLADADVQP